MRNRWLVNLLVVMTLAAGLLVDISNVNILVAWPAYTLLLPRLMYGG